MSSFKHHIVLHLFDRRMKENFAHPETLTISKPRYTLPCEIHHLYCGEHQDKQNASLPSLNARPNVSVRRMRRIRTTSASYYQKEI